MDKIHGMQAKCQQRGVGLQKHCSSHFVYRFGHAGMHSLSASVHRLRTLPSEVATCAGMASRIVKVGKQIAAVAP